jgi:hypothetical protein
LAFAAIFCCAQRSRNNWLASRTCRRVFARDTQSRLCFRVAILVFIGMCVILSSTIDGNDEIRILEGSFDPINFIPFLRRPAVGNAGRWRNANTTARSSLDASSFNAPAKSSHAHYCSIARNLTHNGCLLPAGTGPKTGVNFPEV